MNVSSQLNSSIISQNNRLVVTDKNGVVKRYRMVIRDKNNQLVNLSAETEQKATDAVLAILSEVGLNNSKTDLNRVHLKGRTVKYKSKKHAVKEESYKKFIDTIAFESNKTTVSGTSKLNLQLPTPSLPIEHAEDKEEVPFTEPVEKDKPNEHIKTTKKQHVVSSLWNRFSSGAKSLEDIQTLLVEMEKKQGKLRLNNGGVKFSPSEVGLAGRKGTSQKSQNAILYILGKIESTLATKNSAENLTLAKNILKLLKNNSWSNLVLKNNAETRSLLEAIETSIKEYSRTSLTLLTSRDFFYTLINGEDRLRSDFLIAYRTMFSGDVYYDSPQIDAIPSNQNTENLETIRMLNFLIHQLNTSKNGQSSELKVYKNTIKLLDEWLSDISLNQMEYRNPEVNRLITTIIEKIPDLFLVSKTRLLKKLDEISGSDFIVKSDDNPISWPDESDALREGKVTGQYYKQLVDDFANDVNTLVGLRLKQINSSDLDSNHAESNFSSYSSFLDDLSVFVASQIVKPINGKADKNYSLNMMKFFLDVQEKLKDSDSIDAMIAIKRGFNLSPVARLGLTDQLPRYQQNQIKKLELAPGNQKLLLSTKFVKQEIDYVLSNTYTVVNKDLFNVSLIPQLAELKRPLLKAISEVKGGAIKIESFEALIGESRNLPVLTWSYKLMPNQI